MTEILQSLAANLADFFIYLAIALVAVIGVVKCVLPVRRVARRLNRGVRLLVRYSLRYRRRPVR